MVITCYSNLDSSVPIEVELYEFVKKSPDSFFQHHIEGDNRYYLPRHVLTSTKKSNPKGGKDIFVPTNIHFVFNSVWCFDGGYCLRANRSRSSGRKGYFFDSEAVRKFVIYWLHFRNHFRMLKGSVVKKYKQENCVKRSALVTCVNYMFWCILSTLLIAFCPRKQWQKFHSQRTLRCPQRVFRRIVEHHP